jgi:beta-aspartyl-dipeptidase (metallo-type)
MLAGKAGIVNIHMGDGKNGLGYLYKIIEEGILSPKNILPTHINRSQDLLEQGRDYAKIGGLIDLTTSSSNQHQDINECAESLHYLLREDVPVENITLSSDAQGSLPKFDQDGKMTGMRIGQVTSLYESVKSAVQDFEIDLSQALKVITSNPARIFGLDNKGKLDENLDADLVILDKEDLTIETVIAKGNIMLEDKKAVVKGTFQ